MRGPHTAGVKRSLSHVGGAVQTEGDAGPAKALAEALEVTGAAAPEAHKLPEEARASDEDEPDRAHIHGFHPYPARMHPLTAARLVRAFSPSNGLVLDPFCGSGTVLVEAMIAGRNALGTDLNPFAVRLSRGKTARHTDEGRHKLVAAAATARAHADERRRAKAGATRRYGKDDMDSFEPHVLLELDGLRASVLEETDPATRSDLFLVLSAILIKVSRRRSDTSQRPTEKRMAAGYTAKLFLRKAEELARRSAAFESMLPSTRPRVRVREDDATMLESIDDESVQTIVSSPPYAATYDYLAHHALRMRWLNLSPAALEDREMGSRRRYSALTAGEAERSWVEELGRFFRAASRVVVKGGGIVLVLADSEARGHALRSDVLAAAAARRAKLVPSARASQERPHFHDASAFAKAPRREHALYFRKV